MPEGEEREKGTEPIFEVIMTENYFKLMSDTKSLPWNRIKKKNENK